VFCRAAVILLVSAVAAACGPQEGSGTAPAQPVPSPASTASGTPEPVAASPTPAAPSAPLITDRQHYVMTPGPHGPETTIATTFTAPADRSVYIVNCGGAFSMGLQRLENGTWKDHWIGAINECLSAPIVVPPGGRHSGVMRVVSERHHPIPGGTYRAAWYSVLTSFDTEARPFGPDLPLEQRVSAPITIEVADQ
jgi:hypothetical protein